jgi:hypothetical protein
MKGTEKKFVGPALVLGIIVLATLGAGLTWRNYVADRPSALRAEFVDGGHAQAEFAPEVAPRIRPGTKAIISREGARSTGFIEQIPGKTSETSFRVKLLQPFADVLPGTPCEITVDLSIPPEQETDGGGAPSLPETIR